MISTMSESSSITKIVSFGISSNIKQLKRKYIVKVHEIPGEWKGTSMEALKRLAGAGLRIAVAFLIVSALDAPGPRAGEDGPGPDGAPPEKNPAAPRGAGGETELSPRAEGK